MRTAVDYEERAEECRRLAKVYTRPEDWAHFLEMAKAWKMRFKHQQERSRLRTIAPGDRFRNVLFLSGIAPKAPADMDHNEQAA